MARWAIIEFSVQTKTITETVNEYWNGIAGTDYSAPIIFSSSSSKTSSIPTDYVENNTLTVFDQGYDPYRFETSIGFSTPSGPGYSNQSISSSSVRVEYQDPATGELRSGWHVTHSSSYTAVTENNYAVPSGYSIYEGITAPEIPDQKITVAGGIFTVTYAYSDASGTNSSSAVHVVGPSSFNQYQLVLIDGSSPHIFSTTNDNVDFNNLEPWRERALRAGAPIWDSSDGNDTVILPSISKAAILGLTTRYTFHAGIGDDTITGSDDGDFIDGGDDNDTLYGGDNASSRDVLVGGKGYDELYGQSGNDDLWASSFDFGYGQRDNDANLLFGGDGEDSLYAVTLNNYQDVLYGGSDKDTYYVDGRDKIVNFEVGETAYLTAGSAIDKAIVYSEPGRTLISFFSRDDGLLQLVSRVEFGQTIAPDDFDIVIGPNIGGVSTAKITHSPSHGFADAKDFADVFKEFAYYAKIFKPLLDFGAGQLFSKLYKAALADARDFLKKQIMVAVEAAGENLPADTIANVADKLAEKAMKKILVNMAKDKTTEADLLALSGEIASAFVETVNPLVGKVLKFGKLFAEIYLEYAKAEMQKDLDATFVLSPNTRTILGPEPGVKFQSKSFETSDSRFGFVNTQDALKHYSASKTKANYLVSAVDVDVAPKGVQTIRLADAPSSADNLKTISLKLGGNAENNELIGNSRNNFIAGKEGNDELTGGKGRDSFVFNTSLKRNVDTITDFTSKDDAILLDNAIFKAFTSEGAISKGQFKIIGTGAKIDASDRIIYDLRSENVYYDADGSGKGTSVNFLHFESKVALSAADFIVI